VIGREISWPVQSIVAQFGHPPLCDREFLFEINCQAIGALKTLFENDAKHEYLTLIISINKIRAIPKTPIESAPYRPPSLVESSE
jgi:hypothetical protein